MLSQIEIGAAGALAASRALAALYPWVAFVDSAPGADAVTIRAEAWRAPGFDPVGCDEVVAAALARHGSVSVRIEGEPEVIAEVALQVTTRYQRLIAGRNRASADPLFDRALGLHRGLHDRRKPLVAADHDHALDTWRWVLRLEPDAGLAAQLAALFHDVERLVSEADVRVEQHAADYARFKDAHAAEGARLVARVLADAGAEVALIARVADLVRTHEHPDSDPDKALVNEADALSFFSLNACGFSNYYGPAHTRRKVAYTLARLGQRGCAELSRMRHRADVLAMVLELDRTAAVGGAA